MMEQGAPWRCATCGRVIEVLDGRWVHRLPRPAGVPVGTIAEREWGTELGLFTLATLHDAVPR